MEKASFNLFRNLVLSEDGHSSLLKKIIHPRGSHGKGNLFLKIFFEEVLHLPFNDSDKWEVVSNVRTGKRSYADIVIYNLETAETYLIENKVKGAKDQPSQLYRYWYGLKYGSEYRTDSIGNREATKIYYLTYANAKPTAQSLTRPNNSTYNAHKQKNIALNDILQDDLICCISYRIHITAFLKKILRVSSHVDSRFRSTIEQYLECIENNWI